MIPYTVELELHVIIYCGEDASLCNVLSVQIVQIVQIVCHTRQVRLVVDDLPIRHSAAYTSPAGPYESYVDTLGGHLVIQFGAGNHSVRLQWKKSIGGIVTSWSNRPSSHDGFAGGRSIVVTAQVSHIFLVKLHTVIDYPQHLRRSTLRAAKLF